MSYPQTQNTHVIDNFLADNLSSSFLTSQNITSQNITFKSLTLDGNLTQVNFDAPNFNFEDVELDYSDPWIPKWTTRNKAFILDKRERGAFLANGKIGMLASFDRIDTQHTFITTHLQYNSGTYQSNVIEPFHVNSLKVFRTTAEDQIVYTNKQEFNLKTAILSSHYKIIDKISGQYVHAKVDMFTPRQIPYGTMQTITLKREDTQSELKKVTLFHEVYAKGNLREISYNNNILHHTKDDGTNISAYVLSGNGLTNTVASSKKTDTGTEVAFATIYIVEESKNVENKGFNVYQNRTEACYNTFDVHFWNEKTNTYKNEITVHIFSCIMTDLDFQYPLEEAKKLVLTIYHGMTGPLHSIQKVRSDHVLSWNKLWQTNISITPKSNITEEEKSVIDKLNRYIRFSLFNLYSASRETLNMGNTKSLPFIDIDGAAINDGDLWLLPLMLYIKPNIARSMLDFRYQMINIAQQIAGSYGYQGAKFPYVDSIGGYKEGVHWNTLSPLSVFHNAVIGINTWNYYRVTRDKDWLISRGYPILKNIADFIVSVAEKEEETSIFHIRNVVGLNGLESKKDNSFTNYMCKLALRYVIEASYELKYYVKDIWLDTFFGIPVLFVNENEQKIIKFDAGSIEEDTYKIIEMFFILSPYYSKIFFEDNDSKGIYRTPEVIIGNIEYYIDRIKTMYTFHPYNIALLAILYGLYAQYEESYVDKYNEYMKKFTENYITGIWNNMTTFGTRRVDNSFNMNAILLMIIMQGLTDAHISGGVSETGFYYEEMKLRVNIGTNMPSTWSNIRYSNIGDNKKNYFIRNNTLYIASP